MTVRLHLRVLPVLAPVLCASALSGAAPPLREQISLNGAWRQGGVVPVYSGDGFDAKTYSRSVDVPAAWAGKRIRLDFGAVNFIASVFVDGRKAAEHIGGWIPFSVDVTDLTKPGRSFELRVDVLDRTHPPITDERGKMLWPLGGETPSAGIVDDVWLRAYGEVCIEDAQIITSVRRKTLEVRYTVRNTTARTARVVVAADVVQPGRSGIIARATSQPVEIPAGETRTAAVTREWENADLWWPDRPTLYNLESKVLRDGKTPSDTDGPLVSPRLVD
jgi:beta-galactosidase/beta-glucuronidase